MFSYVTQMFSDVLQMVSDVLLWAWWAFLVSWVCWGVSQNRQISGMGFVNLIVQVGLEGLVGHVSLERLA